MHEEINITSDFFSSFRNEEDFYKWLVDIEKTHDIVEVIDDIIKTLTILHLDKFVLKAIEFKHKYK